MPKMIQVRSVPDKLHRELLRRAKKRGQTLTDYIQQILEREVARPPAEDVFERIARRTPVNIGRPIAEIIREERERRDEHLERVLRRSE
jgi:antitoxin FitA